MRNLKMLLLSRKFDIYSSRRLVEEGQLRSHSVALWDPEWPLTRLKLQPDVLLPRLGSFQFAQALETFKQLQAITPVTINPSQNYARARNKWKSFLTFQEARIATPSSRLISEQALEHPFTYPVIVKELESSKGEGVFLIEDQDKLVSFLQNTKEVLAQEFFPEAFGTDVRAFVIGDQVVAAMKRQAQPGEFRSNLALGATAEACTLSSAEEELVLKTVHTLGLQVSGVDLLRTRKGSLVLEANPCPGLEGIEKYSKQNLAARIIRFAEELYDKHSSPR